jgi:hypothetical protein
MVYENSERSSFVMSWLLKVISLTTPICLKLSQAARIWTWTLGCQSLFEYSSPVFLYISRLRR